ncbi:hypothetical protein [Paraburkholderia elongata]|uniref:hypothetical protein n=1 Tax=Paraburkholderia elongata TaxID=2675747 RepID=UPI002E2BE7F6|nr:hypothetical protein [Paraburkholderia elongata]
MKQPDAEAPLETRHVFTHTRSGNTQDAAGSDKAARLGGLNKNISATLSIVSQHPLRGHIVHSIGNSTLLNSSLKSRYFCVVEKARTLCLLRDNDLYSRCNECAAAKPMPEQELMMTTGPDLFDLARKLEDTRWQLLLNADVNALPA